MTRTLSTHRYRIELSYSDLDQGWIAEMPDLSHCCTFGNTPRDALDELERALAAWMQSARTHQKPVPEAMTRQQVASQKHSPEM